MCWMVGGNDNGKTATAPERGRWWHLRAATGGVTGTADARGDAGGNPTVGGNDDGDCGRSWRCAWYLGGPWRDAAAGRETAADELSGGARRGRVNGPSSDGGVASSGEQARSLAPGSKRTRPSADTERC